MMRMMMKRRSRRVEITHSCYDTLINKVHAQTLFLNCTIKTGTPAEAIARTLRMESCLASFNNLCSELLRMDCTLLQFPLATLDKLVEVCNVFHRTV